MSMIPDEVPQGPAASGHNQRDLVADLRAEQTDALARFIERRDYLVERCNTKKVTDRISAGEAGDIIANADKVWKMIDQDRRERTDPHRQAADAAKAVADGFWEPVVEAEQALRARLKEWNDAEDDRIAAQRRQQEEAMREMRQASQREPAPQSEGGPSAPAPSAPALLPAKPRKVRGDLGSIVSSVERASYTVTDVRAVPDFILNSQTVKDAIVTVVRSMARHLGDIPGVEKTFSSDIQVKG